MRSAQFLDNLNDAVRESPIAAGLIGVGLAWMLFGGSRTVIRDTQGAARLTKDTINTATDAASEAIEPVAGVVDQMRTAATDISDAVSDGMKAAASKMSQAVGRGSMRSPRGPDPYGERPHLSRGRELVDFLERRPLALAVVGVAVGAAIASAFPRTAGEDRLVGSTGDMLREKVNDAADAVADRAAAVIEETTEEAVAQDLTPDAARKAVRAGATKVKNVARAGVEASYDD